jgi:hypothetical protein
MADVPVRHAAGEHPENHEHSDVDIRKVVLAGAALASVVIVVMIGLYVLFIVYDRQHQAQELPQSAVQARPARQTDPGIPPLQGIAGFHNNTPAQDMEELRARESQMLSTYGPGVEPGSARIPVTRAMELIVAQKLLKSQPAATQPAPATTGATNEP